MSNTTKKLIHWLHLWPGLISAVIVFFVCLTGTIIVYSDEIINLSAGQAKFVEKVSTQTLPTEQLMHNAVAAVPEAKKTSYMVCYRDPKRSYRFNVFSKKEGLHMVYVDQYSGKVLKADKTIFFFYTVAHLHNSFYLGKTGQWIVDIATLIFLLELITGLILWWPKHWKKTTLKKSLSVKWDAPWKRLSFDLHRVFGVYATLGLLVLIVTGLIIAFEPLSHATLKSFGGEDAHEWEHGAQENFNHQSAGISINQVLETSIKAFPDKNEFKVALWDYEKSPYMMVAATNRAALKSNQSPEIVYIDRTSGSISQDVPATVIRGEQIDNMLWMLHMGNWMGPVGKFLTFLAGLIACMLPVTGFYIWWNKRKTGKKQMRNKKT